MFYTFFVHSEQKMYKNYEISDTNNKTYSRNCSGVMNDSDLVYRDVLINEFNARIQKVALSGYQHTNKTMLFNGFNTLTPFAMGKIFGTSLFDRWSEKFNLDMCVNTYVIQYFLDNLTSHSKTDFKNYNEITNNYSYDCDDILKYRVVLELKGKKPPHLLHLLTQTHTPDKSDYVWYYTYFYMRDYICDSDMYYVDLAFKQWMLSGMKMSQPPEISQKFKSILNMFITKPVIDKPEESSYYSESD
jgi:hypothetical protein